MATKTVTVVDAIRMHPARALRLAQACKEGVDWAATFNNSAKAWEACSRIEWLLWVIHRGQLQDPSKERLLACWCARFTPLAGGGTVWDLLSDPRSRDAVEVADRYARGLVNGEELAAAREAAQWVATVEWAAAPPKVRAAAAAAAWAAAEDSVRAAIESATAAATAGSEAAEKAQADTLRQMFGNPFTDRAANGQA
jgi:hypothetical protein